MAQKKKKIVKSDKKKAARAQAAVPSTRGIARAAPRRRRPLLELEGSEEVRAVRLKCSTVHPQRHHKPASNPTVERHSYHLA